MSQNTNNYDKNLKLMIISAVVLFILFFYTMYKSSNAIQGSSYYIGLFFLFLLMGAAFFLRIYKEKIKKYLPGNSFEEQLTQQKQKQTSINISTNEQQNIDAVHSNITFNDVAGIDLIKQELQEIVDFLNKPKKYLEFGVKLPKGVLLVGPPGVGKTLIAKAVAGEAQVPFFYQSGASFVHIYVGMGAKRVRELFAKAKAHAPSIVFIDEIDAIGKERSGKSNDEREATLNELLTQMDGFEDDNGVIVIAATNKIEILDEALLRAGRFDRRVFIGLPNIQDRTKILELYLKNKTYNFDLKRLANETSGFNSAALSTLINEALLNMIKRDGNILEQTDIDVAKNKIEFGKKDKLLLSQKQKEILAIYQASKSFITKCPIALFDEGIKKSDLTYASKQDLLDIIKKYLSGSVGVEVIKNEPYAMFESDLKKADEIANDMVEKYKMGRDKDSLIDEVRAQLKLELSSNIDEIIRLKDIMLRDEVVL